MALLSYLDINELAFDKDCQVLDVSTCSNPSPKVSQYDQLNLYSTTILTTGEKEQLSSIFHLWTFIVALTD